MFPYLSYIIVCISHFFVDMMIGLWPAYKTFAHLDIAIAGLISGVCAFLGEGMQVFFGSWSDRGYRKMLIFTGLITSLSAAALFYTRDYVWIFVLYLGVCFGSGSFHPAAVSFVSDAAKNKTSVLISVFACAGSIGLALSQLIFFQLDTLFEGAVYLIALPAVFLAIFSCVKSSVCRGAPTMTLDPLNSPPPKNIKGIIQFFKQRNLRLLYIFQVCNGAVFWGGMFLLPDILVSRGYSSEISFGYGHFMFVLGSASMMIPAGFLADRFSSRSVIMGAMLCSSLLLYALVLSPFLRNAEVLALLFFLGATLGLVNPIAVALATRLAPHQKGLVSAFAMGLVLCVSEVIGHSGGGIVSTFFREDAAAMSLAVLGSLLFIGYAATSSLTSEGKQPASVQTEAAQK